MLSIMVIAVGYGIGDLSSNTRRAYLRFLWR